MSDDVAAYYRVRFTPDPARAGAWRAIVRYLQSYVPSDGSVVELGAGYCFFINQVKAREKHAVELSEDIGPFAAPGVSTHVGSCESLAFAGDGSVDAVMASNLFEHLERDVMRRTLAEILRVLRPGGRLIVLQPNFAYAYREYFDDYTHVAMYTHIGLRDLLIASGFIVERVTARFLPYTMRSRLPAWPWLVSLYLRSPWRPLARQMLIVARRPR
jgi:SAM-dependent methyltransferase